MRVVLVRSWSARNGLNNSGASKYIRWYGGIASYSQGPQHSQAPRGQPAVGSLAFRVQQKPIVFVLGAISLMSIIWGALSVQCGYTSMRVSGMLHALLG